jgi:aspartate aminotransferase-like enzyme
VTPTPPLLLMTPGPSRVPDRVLAAGAQPAMHHRTPEFSEQLGAVVEMMRPLYGTSGDVLPVHTTGRGAMEATICNLFSPGDELIACCNGKFGNMWAGFAESYGLTVHRICKDWSQGLDLDEVDSAMSESPTANAVLVVHSDTSTGVLNDVEAVAALARNSGKLCLVDSISGIGGVEFRFEEWGVDVAVTGSQKCLMSSPGLAFVALGARAWAAAESGSLPSNYWNFQAIRKNLAGPLPETPGTTPVHLVLQLREALEMIHEEGLPSVYERHAGMARMAVEHAKRLGLELQCPNLPRHSPTLTAIGAPEAVTADSIRDRLRAQGILVAVGLGPFEGRSVRIGHMGDIRPADVERTLAALSGALEGLPH